MSTPRKTKRVHGQGEQVTESRGGGGGTAEGVTGPDPRPRERLLVTQGQSME